MPAGRAGEQQVRRQNNDNIHVHVQKGNFHTKNSINYIVREKNLSEAAWLSD